MFISTNNNDNYSEHKQWEDDQAVNRYDRFNDPDPHADDYPSSGPPSYMSQEDVTKVSDDDQDDSYQS